MQDQENNSMVKENGDLQMQQRNHCEIEITKVGFEAGSNCNSSGANSISIFSMLFEITVDKILIYTFPSLRIS